MMIIGLVVVAAICVLLCCTTSIVIGRAWAFTPSLSVEQSREWKSLQSQSHIAYDTGKKTLALLLFKQLLQSPKNPRVLTDLGNVENELYNFTGALHYFRQALVIAPKHIGALVGVGDSLGQLGNHLQAIEYYKQAVSAPIPSDLAKSPWLLGERADAFIHLGNYSETINIANEILNRNATNVDGLESKGIALLEMKNDRGALATFNKILQHHIVAAWILDNKAEALTQLGNYTGAIFTADASITLDPKDAYAWYDRAAAFLGLDLYSKPNTPHSQTLVFKDIDAMLQDLNKTINPHDQYAQHLKTLLKQGLDFEYIRR